MVTKKAALGMALGVVLVACASGPVPLPVGGPCEYTSYDGRCSFANVRSEPSSQDSELSTILVTYRAQKDLGLEFTDYFTLPTREVAYAERYYRRFGDVECKGQRIKTGTCAPQTGGVAIPRFRFPGSPHEHPGGCEQPLACDEGCKNQNLADCARGGYGAFFGVETVPDRTRAMYNYRSALKLAIKECGEGNRGACTTAATFLETDLVGDLPPGDKAEALATLYRRACDLGERWACSVAQGVAAPPAP
ncbi:MAG: hypothetical protein JST00_39545 [Deltaproteobacteria bacterium]|nr:hypothetical protein [Deltaproteobacteria bacterium]